MFESLPGESFLQAGDADDGAEGLEVLLVAALGGENPGQGLVAFVVGEFGLGGVAIGEEDQAVILLVFVVEVDGRLEVGAASTGDADAAGGLLELHGFVGGDVAVKLDDVDLLDTLLEEAVDDSEKFADILVGDTAADVHSDQQASAVGILAAHGIEAVAPVGAHACEMAFSAQD